MENKETIGIGKEMNELDIDLLELLHMLKERFAVIVIAGLLGALLAGGFSLLFLIPQYSSSTIMYMRSNDTILTSLSDLQIGAQLTQDYKVIVTSRPVLQKVIDALDLRYTYRDLKGKLSVENPKETRILTITAYDADPYMAKKIADETAAVASDYIGEIMEMVPPKVIEEAEIPITPIRKNCEENAVLGAMAGMLFVCLMITIDVVRNDTICGEEDVAAYLGLSVLASVPDRGDGESVKRKRWFSKKKKSEKQIRGRSRKRGTGK